MPGDRLHLPVLGKHQRQFLLEHQHARGHRRDDIPALLHPARKFRDIRLLGLRHGIQVTQFQLRHATALLGIRPA